MKKFKHKTITTEMISGAELAQILDKNSNEGWNQIYIEAIKRIFNYAHFCIVFQQEIDEAEEQRKYIESAVEIPSNEEFQKKMLREY